MFAPAHFSGEGPIKVFYYAILISHMILAIAQVPLVLTVLTFALRGQFARHRRLARITVPVWLYVVATGWIVYGMLYMRG